MHPSCGVRANPANARQRVERKDSMDYNGRKVSVYRVEKGDTPQKIAQKLGLPLEAILKANPALAYRKPEAGETLLIYNPDTRGSTAQLSLEEINSLGQTVRKANQTAEPDPYKALLEGKAKEAPKEEVQGKKPEDRNAKQTYKPRLLDIKQLSDAELVQMAREIIDPKYAGQLEKKEQDYQQKSQKINEKLQANRQKFQKALEDLTERAKEEKSKAVADTVKNKTITSSIFSEILKELGRRQQERQEQTKADYMQAEQGLKDQLNALAKERAAAIDALNKARQADYDAQIKKLKEANERAAKDIYNYNANQLKKASSGQSWFASSLIGSPQAMLNQYSGKDGQEEQIKLTKQLLSTLTKQQAKDYLTKNEKNLRSLWGSRYDDILKDYS